MFKEGNDLRGKVITGYRVRAERVNAISNEHRRIDAKGNQRRENQGIIFTKKCRDFIFCIHLSLLDNPFFHKNPL